MQVVSVTNEDEHLQRQTETATDIAQRFQITTQEIADQAARHLSGVLALRKTAEEHHRPTIQAAHDTWKKALAMLRRIDEPLEKAEKLLRMKLGAWSEKVRLEAEAERRRLEAEQRRLQAEEAERVAAEAMKQGATEDEVEAVMDQVMMAPAPVIVHAPVSPAVSGFYSRETWSAQVTDVKALCKAIADGTASVHFVEPNMTALNQMARAQKNTLNIAGVKAVRNVAIAQGRR